ncbi:kinesin-like protein KIF25 [Ylistrum balloti]|uniref:kinesin-like protein KIF25 n=1 Tax=Ylistrum balloti TaxID=509963 RepID=UPI0029057F0B|nr:kinesin-like protein KIF25 [Ylistrum balloti]
MPLGIDRSHFYADKIKHYEKDMRTKDERISTLETENAMLYLKLAQLRGTLQKSREDMSGLQNQFDSEQKFRKTIAQSAAKLKQDLYRLREDLSDVHKIAIKMPQDFSLQIDHASSVIHRHRHMFQSQTSSLSVLQDKIEQMSTALQDITDRHAKEKKRRQELHNTLMELRGNIRVHCRLRPLMEFDTGLEDPSTLGRVGTKSEVVVHYVDDENACVRTAKHNKVFEFERVYDPNESQDNVFYEVQPMLTSLLDGYNICIMAYGQTGSGKTHTMLGSHKNEDYNASLEPHPDEGVIPRAARELFRLISEKPERHHTIEVSVVEIYNNDIRDLLGSDANMKHDISTGVDNSINLPTISFKEVDNVYDVMCLVQRGLKARRESSTLVHDHSSRSHLVVTLTVNSQAPSFFSKPSTQDGAMQQTSSRDARGRSLSVPMSMISGPGPVAEPPSSGDSQAVIRTKLQLVDLAGSECVGMSGVTGAALREASHINKSLSALADVLGALSEHRAHVPYRNSRLTHLLQDSIGGDAKLLVLLCVSPSQRYITESLQCMGFGTRARQVARGPTKRRLPSSAEKVSAENAQRPRTGKT